jgi:predicted metal-dependent hydrolase
VAQGYGGILGFNRFFVRVMSTYARYLPRYSLALTVIVEQMTASLARSLLEHPERLQLPMSEDMRLFWRWHAEEEIEHHHVAAEVYDSIGGGRLLLWTAMAQVITGLLGDIFARHCYLMWRDRRLFSASEWRRGIPFLLGRGGLVRRMLAELSQPSL